MPNEKVSPVTIAIFILIAVTVFVPALTFDQMFPTLRESWLKYDDWQMMQFVYECIINNHEGAPIFRVDLPYKDIAKLVVWIILSIGTPLGGLNPPYNNRSICGHPVLTCPPELKYLLIRAAGSSK